jgi:diguanylate cyclase (GGDEF)-like protein/PAS domain S-box-containing protein
MNNFINKKNIIVFFIGCIFLFAIQLIQVVLIGYKFHLSFFIFITLVGGIIFLLLNKIFSYRNSEFKLSSDENNELINNFTSGVAVYKVKNNGEDFIFENINDTGLKMDKIDRKNVIGRNAKDVFPSVESFGLLNVFKKVYLTGKSEKHPVALYKDGRIQGYRSNYVYKTKSGKIVSIYNDENEIEKIKVDLLGKNELLNGIYNSVIVGLSVWDKEFNLISINEGFKKITGYGYGDIKNINDWHRLAYLDENYRKIVIDAFNESKNCKNYTKQFIINCKNGENKDIEFNIVYNENDRFIATLIDVSESNKLKEELKKNARYLKSIILAIPETILVLNENGEYIDVWLSDEECSKEKFAELIGKKIDEFFPKAVARKYHKYIKLAIQTKKALTFDYFIKINNKKNYFDVSIEFLELRENMSNVLVVIRDITDYIETKNILSLEKERLELAIEIGGLGIWEHNINADQTQYYEKWEEMLGYSGNEIDKTNDGWIKLIHKDDKEEVLNALKDYLEGRSKSFKKKYRLIKKDGTYKWIYDVAKIVDYNRKGKPSHLIGIHLDIDESMKTQEKIEYLSYRDGLTGVYNRRYFENEIERVSNSRNLPISIVIADMDRLKHINDTYGHKIGDKYLLKIAEIVTRVTRKDEIVARIGGDEFAVVVSGVERKEIELLCERIKNEISKFNIKKELPLALSVSLGYAVKNKHSEDINEIFIKADLAMYEEKKRSRNLRS